MYAKEDEIGMVGRRSRREGEIESLAQLTQPSTKGRRETGEMLCAVWPHALHEESVGLVFLYSEGIHICAERW